MPYDVAELQMLSQLLDEAFELDREEIDPWLAGKARTHRSLVPALRQMLDEHRAQISTRFLVARARWNNLSGDAAYRPGDAVGPYRLIRRVGLGGMSAVWLADRGSAPGGRPIALKLPRRAACPRTANRMDREAQIGMRFQHPQVARQLDTGHDALQRRYIALEYIAGKSLITWADARRLDAAARLRLFLGVLDAVSQVHAQGVVHRDLKPANVLVDKAGTAHVIDFGIAMFADEPDALPDDGVLRSLTPGYASPEQLRGEVTGYASDNFTLGVLLAELLIGRSPIVVHTTRDSSFSPVTAASTTAATATAAILAHPTMASRQRDRVAGVLSSALEELPALRYASCDELSAALKRCI